MIYSFITDLAFDTIVIFSDLLAETLCNFK